MVRPISPKEALYQRFIPDEVIEAFNELIMEKITPKCVAVIDLDDVLELIIRKGLVSKEDQQDIFENGWLNVENIYNNNGWVVTFDIPPFRESNTEATFTFKSNRKGPGAI